MLKEFDFNSFFRVIDIITDKKDWVNNNIDKEIFNELKIKEYSQYIKKEEENNQDDKKKVFFR